MDRRIAFGLLVAVALALGFLAARNRDRATLPPPPPPPPAEHDLRGNWTSEITQNGKTFVGRLHFFEDGTCFHTGTSKEGQDLFKVWGTYEYDAPGERLRIALCRGASPETRLAWGGPDVVDFVEGKSRWTRLPGPPSRPPQFTDVLGRWLAEVDHKGRPSVLTLVLNKDGTCTYTPTGKDGSALGQTQTGTYEFDPARQRLHLALGNGEVHDSRLRWCDANTFDLLDGHSHWAR